jgi:mannitol/fructose-specific phosphotransferase system IIA component (Ntr-type)
MSVLAALAEVLDDEASLERLRTTSDPTEVVQILDPA